MSNITTENVKTINSREVAEMVNRRHDQVIRDINTVVKHLSTDHTFVVSDYFLESNYKDSTGRTVKCFELTKKGCELYATRMSGAKGTQFAVRYIERFNEMEQVIQTISEKDKLLLTLFSKNPAEVANAHKQLVALEVREATTPLIETIEEQKPKVERYDEFMESDGTYTATKLGKKLGFRSAQAFNKFLVEKGLVYKDRWTDEYQASAKLPSDTYKYVTKRFTKGDKVHHEEKLRFLPKMIDYLVEKKFIKASEVL